MRRGGEVVFNTSLTGYQEVFTDPSYAGQIVCLTYPHIGNVGANLEDEESSRPYIESLIVREFSQVSSNWRSAETTQLYLNRHKIPVIWDIDTRALVRHIRKVGALRGLVATDGTPADQLIHEAKQTRVAKRARFVLSRTISASSRTFCACSWITTAKLPWSPRKPRRKKFWAWAPMACFSRTARATPSRSITPWKISAS